ncbi:MAG TPA: ATP-dependent helicase, partial [Acidimicrobiales bacterium]|nr:ATP-dependent helicase [Acidimicrobiales bacterium]
MVVTRGTDPRLATPAGDGGLAARGEPAQELAQALAAPLTADLTGEQARAVTTPARTVCVLAAAGAGKTRVLTRRIAYRIAAGTATPEHVLAITFTRKAAGELRDRLVTSGGAGVATGTFHSLSLAQLRRYWSDRHVPAPVLIESKLRLLGEIVAGRPGLRDVALADLASEIEWAKARSLAPEELATSAIALGRQLPCEPDELAALYSRYEHEKRKRRLVDFDDLLARYADALQSDARFAAAQRWRWRHVFVDELQDVNPLQCRLLEALVGDNDDFFVVGDPNQAIYGWNGADPGFLLEFPRRWPSAEVVHLSANHRSTPEIVTAAASVLGNSHAAPSSTRASGP